MGGSRASVTCPRPTSRARSAVVNRTRDSEPDVRAAALKALARLGLSDDELLPILKENLRNEDERVRLAAVNLLVDRRALLKRMASELESLLPAEQVGVSRHAAYLLGKLGMDATPLLLRALRQEKSRIDQIAEALAQIGRSAAGLLTQAVEAPEPRVRRGAALALGQIRPVSPGTVRKLTVGLGDADREVKTAFLTAIGFLGPRASESVPAVRALLKDKSAEIRIKAVEILSQSAPRDEQLLGDLIDLLDDSDAGRPTPGDRHDSFARSDGSQGTSRRHWQAGQRGSRGATRGR